MLWFQLCLLVLVKIISFDLLMMDMDSAITFNLVGSVARKNSELIHTNKYEQEQGINLLIKAIIRRLGLQ